MAAAGERVRLGRTRVNVTRLVLGCAPLGGLYREVSTEDAASTLEAAYLAGVRAFDVAPHYGAGLAERRLGAFLASVPRDDVVISTKVGRLLVEATDAAAPAPPEFTGEPPLSRLLDYSGDGVRRSLEESLRRLGTDRIDVALVHDPDDYLDQAIGEAVPALCALRDQGMIGAVGAGMNDAGALAQIVERCDVDCVLVAGRYSLLDQRAADALLPASARRNVAVLAAGVFNSEVLVNPVPGAHYDYRPAPSEVVERARAIGEVCRRFSMPLAAAALRFPLQDPRITAVVVGARTAAEVREDVALLDQAVPERLYRELAELGLIEEVTGTP